MEKEKVDAFINVSMPQDMRIQIGVIAAKLDIKRSKLIRDYVEIGMLFDGSLTEAQAAKTALGEKRGNDENRT